MNKTNQTPSGRRVLQHSVRAFIEVDPLFNIDFQQGLLNVDGTGFNELNAPCDAKIIGDYTGLTPPPPSIGPA